jgi:hypothetical protein
MTMKKSNSCPLCKRAHAYGVAEALKTLARTPAKLRGFVNGLTARQLGQRPAEDKWSIREIITHLADTEIVYGFRYRKMLAEESPELAAFDQESWAGNLNYRERDFNSVLDLFEAVRGHNVDLAKRKSAKEWKRTGTHPQYGPIRFEQLVIHAAFHDTNHLEQIQRLRKGMRSRG